MSQPRTVRAPRGKQLTCKSWLIEAAYRMIQNNLDPEVAERPQDLVVYGGRGQAARSWQAFDAILASLRDLENDETLLVQSGKPVAVFRTHLDAPRVLIANSNLVPHWATQAHFDELAARGLMMFGQMTAGSWIYIGTQGILQGTYETLGALARQRGWGSLKGKFVLTAGLGGMGGAQPLAITMNEGVGLIVEVDPARAQRRCEIGYVDVVVDTLEEAMTLVEESVRREEPKSIGLIGNAAEIYPELVLRGVTPDVVTDQTPAHDVTMYVPAGLNVAAADALRRKFARRHQDQAARAARLGCLRSAAGKVVQDRQGKAGGLAGAGLRRSEQVAAGQHLRNRLRLDRGGRGVAGIGNRTQNGFDQREAGKCRFSSHGVSCDGLLHMWQHQSRQTDSDREIGRKPASIGGSGRSG